MPDKSIKKAGKKMQILKVTIHYFGYIVHLGGSPNFFFYVFLSKSKRKKNWGPMLILRDLRSKMGFDAFHPLQRTVFGV